MPIPEAAVSPFGPNLTGFETDPEGVIARIRDDLDELHRVADTLARLSTAADNPDNSELLVLIVALTLRVTNLEARVQVLEDAPPSTGTGFVPRRDALSAIGDPQSYFADNNPFFWEERRGTGKGDVWYVAMKDSTVWKWEPIKMLGLP